MKIIRNTILVLLFAQLGSALAQVTVAIGGFENLSDQFYLDGWEQSIPEYLISELSKSDKIVLVERRQLEGVLREQALQMSGMVDSSTAQKIGTLLGAQFVVSGTINKTGDWIRLNARIIKVTSGHIKSETVRAKDSDHLSEMVELLANNILYMLAGDRSYQEKIKLRKCPTTYFLLASAGLAVTTIILNNSYQKKLDQYRQAQKISEFDPLYDSANQLHTARNMVAILTGTAVLGTIYCWIRNLSPNEILALHKRGDFSLVPGLAVDYKNGVRAGVNIHF